MFDLENPLLLVVIGVIVLAIIVFLAYILISNNKNKKAKQSLTGTNHMNKYTIKMDFSKEKILIYSHSYNKDPTEYRFNDFINKLDKSSESKWNEWIGKIINDKFDNEEIVIAVKNENSRPVFNQPTKTCYRLNLISKNANCLFIVANEIDMMNYQRVESTKDTTLLDWDEVVSKISNYGRSARGAIICVNCNIYDVVTKRYGSHIADRIMHLIWRLATSYNDEDCIAGHYQDDSFIFYYPNITSAHTAEYKAHELLEEFNTDFSFENYTFTPHLSVGIVFAGTFSYDVMEIVREAYEASKEAQHHSATNIFIYNKELNDEKQTLKKKEKAIYDIINSKPIEATYEPIYNLHGGDVVGYLTEANLKGSIFTDFFDVYQVAEGLNRSYEFYRPMIIAWLDDFVKMKEKKSRRIFIRCNLKMLEEIENIMLENVKYHPLEIVAIITTYNALLSASDKTLDILMRSRQYRINLGLLADDDMRTSATSTLNFFHWLIIPNSLADDITSQKGRLSVGGITDMGERYDLNIIAWHISSFSQAEVLKTLGVGYMHGPIFDASADYDGGSVRKIAKLIDEKE